MKMQHIRVHFYLGLTNESWIGLDCLDVGIYGPQNKCIFPMCKPAINGITNILYFDPIPISS
jgi:hypothetical protein